MTQSVSWLSASSSMDIELSLADEDEECAIMQDKIINIEDINGLPNVWVVNDTVINKARMPCQHHFHVSALALHCALTNMQCPICRYGLSERLVSSCLPTCIAEAVDKQVEQSNRQDANQLTSFNVSVERLSRDWYLMVQICLPNKQTLFATRLLPQDQNTVNLAGHQNFQMQRSFRRNLQIALKEFCKQFSKNEILLRFSLSHQIIDFSIPTNIISLQDIINLSKDCISTRNSELSTFFTHNGQYFGRLHIVRDTSEVDDDECGWISNFETCLHTNFLSSLTLLFIQRHVMNQLVIAVPNLDTSIIFEIDNTI